MKKLTLLTLLFLSIVSSFAQVFEGKIFYTNTYKSKMAQMNDDQLTSMMGSTQEYTIKNGNYKSTLNGEFMQWQLYINNDNKLYSKMSNTEVVYWNDGNIQGDEVLKVELNKEVIEILGYKCDELILTCKSGIQKYYFNSKIAVNTALFSKHKFGNWSDFVSKSNALPLKTIIEAAQFTIESTAVEIKPMKINENLFELPSGIKTEKSPF